MERVVVTVSRQLLYGVAASSLGLAVLVAVQGQDAAPVRRTLAALVLSLPACFAIWKLSKSLRPWVVLDARGIAVSFLGMKTIPWTDVLSATAFTRRGHGWVEVVLRDGERYLRPCDRGALLLPMKTTSHRAVELAALIEQFRAHYHAQSSA